MKIKNLALFGAAALILTACGQTSVKTDQNNSDNEEEKMEKFEYLSEQFSDIKIIRYKIGGFDELTVQQKELVYYLYQVSLSGRDIIYDQNYKYNLVIRKALENVVSNYKGDKESEDWKNLMVYTKRVWFSNGIHHHYSTAKLKPECSKEFFNKVLAETNTTLENGIVEIMFDNVSDMKRVNLDPEKDLIAGSANNFYGEGITQAEVEAFYAAKINKEDKEPISWGLNSTLVKDTDGNLVEQVWKVGGKYSASIEQMVFWLKKAATVAESEDQKKGFELLIKYYETGDLKIWDEYNILWAKTTGDVIDYINGFIEVYGDAMGYRATYESVIQIKDFEASARMKVLQDNVQWFEDNSSISGEHKKEKVVGVTYKVINVAVESGDASPSTPIGVNLPNANWIRAKHGSKSVSLGNIVEAYSLAGGKSMLKEFCYSDEEFERSEKYGKLASKLHTALHEVVGHASGKLNEGVGTPKETLKSYASTLEEGRADLVALYYLLDPKLIEYGLMESLDVGKAEYDSYIRNGLMAQLRRLDLGDEIEEAHMRNRQLVAGWVYEKGQAENIIEKKVKEGKTYFVINDYDKLQILFGDLLKEIQRIKSEGDYEAGMALVENYGVKVDPVIHQEVLDRSAKLNIPPYGGFINPKLVKVEKDGKIIDIKVEYPNDFTKQMMEYGKEYSF
jgi:dipeptidyl-peptidase-3|tara:strand:+ start:2013 stop:4043 length:2031 start_codon:yes stop_codon:yes gene_type:complete